MIYTNSDGGARGNPGPGAIGVVVRRDEEVLILHSSMIGQRVTNNEAEYQALIKALELAQKVGDKEVCCFLDSQLVVRQILGEYKVKEPRMMEYFLQVQKLIDWFDKVKFEYVKREDKFQQIADEILNKEFAKHGFFKKTYKKG